MLSTCKELQLMIKKLIKKKKSKNIFLIELISTICQ